MKVKFNDSEEKEITEEEFEEIINEIIDNGYYFTNISYSFPGYDDLNNTMNSSFSESVTIVENTKEYRGIKLNLPYSADGWGVDIYYDK